MMDSFNYTTVQGDRIDTLSAKFYGDNQGIAIIAEANPDVPLDAVYPLGTVLIMPVIEEVEMENTNDLPPWKR